MVKERFLLLALLVLMTGTCFADVAADFAQIESYFRGGTFGQAEQLCTSIIQNNPDSDLALKAHGKLTAVYVKTGRLTEADAEVNKMMNDFKDNAELPAILYGVMLRYKKAGESQRTENLSQLICQQFPSSEQKQRIQLDSVKEQVFKDISNGKYQQAEGAINNMVAGYGSSPAMAATLYKIAKRFKGYEAYDESMRVYQRIAQDYPNSKFGKKSKMAVDKLGIWNLIKSGDVSGALAAIEKLANDYKGEKDLPHTVHGFGIQFEKIGNFEQARAMYQRAKQDYSDDWVADIATVDLAACDVRAMVSQVQFTDVMSQLNAFKNQFAGHWHLPKAIRQVGQEYQRQAMKSELAGFVGQSRELYSNAISVWGIVINELPDSSARPHALSWSGNSHYKLGEYGKARDCYQGLLDSYPEYRFAWNALYMLGQSYEGLKIKTNPNKLEPPKVWAAPTSPISMVSLAPSSTAK